MSTSTIDKEEKYIIGRIIPNTYSRVSIAEIGYEIVLIPNVENLIPWDEEEIKIYELAPWTAAELKEKEEELDITTLIISSPQLFDSILKAKDQLKKGNFLTHEHVFGHPI